MRPENITLLEFSKGFIKRPVAWNGLTLSWQRSLSYRNQSIDLPCKSMDWFLYDRDYVMKELKLSRNLEKFAEAIFLFGWGFPKMKISIKSFFEIDSKWTLKILEKSCDIGSNIKTPEVRETDTRRTSMTFPNIFYTFFVGFLLLLTLSR